MILPLVSMWSLRKTMDRVLTFMIDRSWIVRVKVVHHEMAGVESDTSVPVGHIVPVPLPG